jgi:SRSO17 transposase
MPLVDLIEQDIEQAAFHFERFHQRFAHHFATSTRTMNQEAKHYSHGQLTCEKKGNLWEFEKTVPESESQSMQHFISNSPWEDDPLLDDVSQVVMNRIGDETHGAIHIDESGFEKCGNMSVGVARQYCGRLGKVENCQMGVFLGYTQANHRILLDRRLYLPQQWISDKARRKKCGVPKDTTFCTKAQFGLELIRVAQKRKLPYAFIGFDCHYGQQPWLLETLENENQTYIADVPCTTRVWLACPLVEIPARKGNRGRIPTKQKVVDNQPAAIEVRKLARSLDPVHWQRVFVRDTERGQLWVRLTALRVYPVRDELPGAESWLIIRINEQTGEIKYQLSNASADTSFQRLAQMSHSRFWMERAIQDAKGQAGLADYQIRSWRGWHHHMTMTILAMLFLLELHLDWRPKAVNLTLCDVREILEVILPKRVMTSAEILKWIAKKHKARLSARHSHARTTKLRKTAD